MVIAAPNDFLLNVGSDMLDPPMIIIEVALTEIFAGTGVSGRQGRAVLQNMEGSVIIDDGIAWWARMVPNLLHGIANGLKRDVLMTVITSEPADEVTNVEVQEKKGGREITGSRGRQRGFRRSYGSHGVQIIPVREGEGGRIVPQPSICPE